MKTTKKLEQNFYDHSMNIKDVGPTVDALTVAIKDGQVRWVSKSEMHFSSFDLGYMQRFADIVEAGFDKAELQAQVENVDKKFQNAVQMNYYNELFRKAAVDAQQKEDV